MVNRHRALPAVWAGSLILISVFILFPLLFVVSLPRSEDFAFVFHTPAILKTIRNTFVICLCSTTMSVLIGYVYAYAVVRGNIPFRKFFELIPVIHLMTPPFVGGLSFILLLGRNGFITKTLFHQDVSLYGFWGLLIAQSLCFFPMAYMILVNVLDNISPSFTQASLSLGCSRFGTFFKVTLPLSFPGIVSSFLFIAISVMSDFGNPMIVAGRYRVLAVEIYTQLTGWVKPGRSALLGTILVVPSILIFILQSILFRKNSTRTATIGGKVMTRQEVKASPVATVALTLFCSFIALCVIAQVAAIVAGSFQKLWGIDTTFTLKHMENIRRYTRELYNSLLFAFEGAVISSLCASIFAFIVYRTDLKLRNYIDIIAQLPSAIPGSLFGLAFSIASRKIGFAGSSFLIVTAIAVGFLPFSYRIMASGFNQIKPSIDEGAMSLGAGRLTVLGTILMPLSGGNLAYAFLYDFVRGVGTMSAVIFLVSFNTPLASIKILNLAEEGFWGDAAALALVLTVITFGILAIGRAVQKIWSHK